MTALQAPTAESLPGFLATAVGIGATARCRSVGYGAAPQPQLAGRLRPIFVQHDRSRIGGVSILMGATGCEMWVPPMHRVRYRRKYVNVSP